MRLEASKKAKLQKGSDSNSGQGISLIDDNGSPNNKLSKAELIKESLTNIKTSLRIRGGKFPKATRKCNEF